MTMLIETAAPRKRPKTTEELIEELYRTEEKAEIIIGFQFISSVRERL